VILDTRDTARQATYDLQRLKRKGLIRRIAKADRYQLTPLGRGVAVLFAKAYGRVLAPGLALADPALPDDVTRRSPLAMAWRALDHALDDFTRRSLVAA
jgi:predicted MarR family transcription regulator